MTQYSNNVHKTGLMSLSVRIKSPEGDREKGRGFKKRAESQRCVQLSIHGSGWTRAQVPSHCNDDTPLFVEEINSRHSGSGEDTMLVQECQNKKL